MNKKEVVNAQRNLYDEIHKGIRKHDFSPFDIYQFVDKDKKEAFIEEQEEEVKTVSQDVIGLLLSAEKQILILAGNLSWSNIVQNDMPILETMKEVAEKGVKIKILCGAHLPAIENIDKILKLNKDLKNKIEVKHAFQPVRAIIIDNKIARIKEIKTSKEYERKDSGKKTFIFYSIYDKGWISWLQKLFHSYFDDGIDIEKRLSELKAIQKIM